MASSAQGSLSPQEAHFWVPSITARVLKLTRAWEQSIKLTLIPMTTDIGTTLSVLPGPGYLIPALTSSGHGALGP